MSVLMWKILWMNDLHNTRCIQFTFHSNISYVAPRLNSIKGPVKFPQMYTYVKGPTPHITHKYTHTAGPPLPGLTPPGWLKAFVSEGQRLSQLRWCHCRLSHGSKPLSSRTTTKKSLCSTEPTCTAENEDLFRSFLFQHVTFLSDSLLPLPFFSPSFKPHCFFSHFNCLYFTLAISITHFLNIFPFCPFVFF